MNKKICIAIDAMGGENAPYKNIKGIDLFYKKNKGNKDFFFNIFGNEEKVTSELKNCSIDLVSYSGLFTINNKQNQKYRSPFIPIQKTVFLKNSLIPAKMII